MQKKRRMIKISQIWNYLEKLFEHRFIREQYPMLTFVSRKRCQKEGAWGLVYMLHHITDKDPKGIPTNEDLKVSPSFLEKMICRYKSKGFDFISLDQLYDILRTNACPTRPFVAFTIDDGYLDNYTQALPVFERQKVPFSVFVATDIIDKKAILWWDSLEDLLLSHDKIFLSDGTCYPCGSYQQRWDSFRLLRERILDFDQKNLKSELTKMFSNYQIDWLEPVRQKGMSWSQITTLANHPLCTIGGHSVSHLALSKLSDNEVFYEIKDSIQKIEKEIGQPVRYFAFPYGTPNEVGNREFRIVEDLKVKLAFCACGGCLTNYNKSFKSHLPRVFFYDN